MITRFILNLIFCVLAATREINDLSRERQRALLRIDRSCDLGSCFPTSGDILIGRENHISATSTCGTNKRDKYCEVTKRETCFWCDSSNDTINDFKLNHRIHNVISKYSGTRGESWWQSENGKDNVSIQLDLEVEFHLKQLMIQFKSYLPKAMLVETSTDLGKTWRVHRYFAYNCSQSFPGVRESTSILTEAVCGAIALSDGTVNFRFSPLNVSLSSKESKNLFRATNLRINFAQLHTFDSNGKILNNSENKAITGDKYYYAIKKMTVLGSCFCNGHAARCIPFSDIGSNGNMVHGRCKCAHNTSGINCKHCDDMFNDLPWKPAVENKTNACKKCDCGKQAMKCHFDSEVFNKSGKLHGGVCDGDD
ncbi:laminin subunit beta-1-like [Leguminivora glycinivorella]|uniref:laminin subunit beta-1-like n=1 Tax=Leguminivora glycinivorella TaxID=1035111 RepID=UPI00200D8C5A|nr:laminin subunit beta-1-like [Leguminivora glycinivorella]